MPDPGPNSQFLIPCMPPYSNGTHSIRGNDHLPHSLVGSRPPKPPEPHMIYIDEYICE